MNLRNEILKTLLYYDIWHYPLSATELFLFLPANSLSFNEFIHELRAQTANGPILEYQGYYFVRGKTREIVTQRKARERHAARLWTMARISAHIIKHFPFVRGVFVSGDLSKNATHRQSDVDFFVITEPGRLWIARTVLIMFKKIFLLNRKKFFCLNYFATTNDLEHDAKNIFVATEIAHLKPLFNSTLFFKYLGANKWINDFFPNFAIEHMFLPKASDRTSFLQKVLEWPFSLLDANRLDDLLMQKMESIWAKRYPHIDDETRRRIFRCTKNESRAYVGDFERKILALYEYKLKEFGVAS
jgi:hypothetical protein